MTLQYQSFNTEFEAEKPTAYINENTIATENTARYLDETALLENEQQQEKQSFDQLLPYPHKEGVVQQKSSSWPYFLEDCHLVLDGFTLQCYNSRSTMPMYPKQTLCLLGHAVVTNGMFDGGHLVTVADSEGRVMDFHCRDEDSSKEWYQALYHAIEVGRGFKRVTPQESFLWVSSHRSKDTTSNPRVYHSDDDLLHMSELNQISLDLLSKRVKEFEEADENRRLMIRRVGMQFVGASLAGAALFATRKSWQPQAESALRDFAQKLPPLEPALAQLNAVKEDLLVQLTGKLNELFPQLRL